MAIIYSYPKVTSPLATDVLVLTDTTLTAGKRKNKTKSLAMSDLATYVVSSTSGITGGGTKDYIPLWTPDGNTIGDSIMFTTSNGAIIQVGTNPGLQPTQIGSNFFTCAVVAATLGSFTNITSGQAGVLTIQGNAIIGDASTDILQISSKVSDYTGTSSTAAGQVLVSTANGQLVWADSVSGLILKSPDGTSYRVTVANGGALSASAV